VTITGDGADSGFTPLARQIGASFVAKP